jgi:general secretion pathway protein A
VLVGQPELKPRLNLPELRQLKQRIGLRCHVPALTLEETRVYIRTRLRIAGARDLGVFADSAVDQISAYAGGIPRLINTVCDHSLLFGYAEQKRRIDRQIVNQAIAYLEGGMRPQVGTRGLRGWRTQLIRWSLGALAVTVVCVATVFAVKSNAVALDLAGSVWRLFAR